MDEKRVSIEIFRLTNLCDQITYQANAGNICTATAKSMLCNLIGDDEIDGQELNELEKYVIEAIDSLD